MDKACSAHTVITRPEVAFHQTSYQSVFARPPGGGLTCNLQVSLPVRQDIVAQQDHE